MGAEFDAAQGFELEGMVSEIAPHGGTLSATGPDKDAIAEGEEALRDANDAAKDLAESMGRVTQGTEESSEAMGALGSIVEGLGSTFADVFTAIAEGEDVAMAAVLKKIGHDLVADGMMNLLKGAGMLLTLNPAGAALMGVGAAEVAAGVGLGAAAGGGASEGSAAAAAPVQRPERDSGGQQSGSRGDGGTVIINYNTPVPNEQIGRQQDTAKRAAERRFGRMAA
jgi:hypothetical protein